MIWRCDLVPQYEAHKREILDAIERVLNSGRYILTSEVSDFENEFAAYIGVKHAVAVANGTDALTLSLMALGIGLGDEVITAPFTAIPTVSAIIDAGATPVFVDVCKDTYLIDLEKLGTRVTARTKAVIPVHLFGNVVDVHRLREIVGPDLPIIEDAAQSHGSTLSGVQSGSMGTIGTFSFYPTKNLGAYGDGGMVVTGDSILAEKLRLLRMYGMQDYNHILINGINSRLDSLQAAVLRVKLRYLDAGNAERNRIAARYRDELPRQHFRPQHIPLPVRSNYHVYVTRFLGNRRALIESLEKAGIQTNIYYLIPLHLQKANEFLGYRRGDFPVAEQLCDEVIALPMYPELKPEIQDRIIHHIANVVSECGEG